MSDTHDDAPEPVGKPPKPEPEPRWWIFTLAGIVLGGAAAGNNLKRVDVASDGWFVFAASIVIPLVACALIGSVIGGIVDWRNRS